MSGSLKQRSTQFNKLPIKIKGKTLDSLMDSGDGVSCIHLDTVNELNSLGHLRILPSTIRQVHGVNKALIPILGIVNLEIIIGDNCVVKQTFHVLPKMNVPVILGMDFMQDNKVKIDFHRKSMTINDNQELIPLKQGKSMVTTTLRASVDTTLLPLTETFVQVCTPVKFSSKLQGEIVPNKPLSKSRKLIGVHSINTLHYDSTLVKIRNPLDKIVKLGKGYPVAHFKPIIPNSSLDVILKEQDKKEQINQVDNPNCYQINSSEFIEIARKLGVDLDKSDLSEQEKLEFLEFIGKNRDVFATNLKEMGSSNLYKHYIDTGDAMPITMRPYRTTPSKMAEIERQVDEMLEADIVKKSNTLWQSSVLLVPKKDGTYRFAVDYRKLNQVTRPLCHPMPVLDDIYCSIGTAQATYFSTLDLKNGFWQIELDPRTAHKSGFVTHSGVYEYKRLPFGMMNSPAAFGATMSEVLRGLTYKNAVIYVDDILVFSKTFQDHMKHLQEVFDRLKKANLKLKPEKCEFATPEVKYLGHYISKSGVTLDLAKTSAVLKLCPPSTVTEMRSFLGLCNYYRRFVKDFAKIAQPLNNLLKKDIAFKWSQECQEAFDKLKLALTSEPVMLAYPRFDKEFILFCDASNSHLGYILSQKDDQNRERVIAYGSKTLNDTQRKYPISEREMMAIIEGVKHFGAYLSDDRPFTIITDHKALKYLSNGVDGNARLTRWRMFMLPYKYTIEYREGRKHENADALSRLKSESHEINSTNSECVSIDEIGPMTEYHFEYGNEKGYSDLGKDNVLDKVFQAEEQYKQVHPLVLMNHLDTEQDDLPKLQLEDKDFGNMIKYLKDKTDLPDDNKIARSIQLEAPDYYLEDSVLYHRYTPRSKRRVAENVYHQLAVPFVLRDKIMKSFHDSFTGGHAGVERCYTTMRQKYWWPNMYNDVNIYVKTCDPCQRGKRIFHSKRAPLHSLKIEGVFERVHLDILGPLKQTKDKARYVLIIVDSFSGWMEAPVLVDQSAMTVAKTFYNEFITRYGAPRSIVTDRGSNFMSQLVQELCKLFDIKRHHTSSYHPQTNASSQKTIGTLSQALRAYVQADQENWAELIPSILMGLRFQTKPQTSGFSPFEIVFGRKPVIPIDVELLPPSNMGPVSQEYLQKLQDNLGLIRDIATENLQMAQDRNKQYYDRKAIQPSQSFKVGDQVLIKREARTVGLSDKLLPYYHKPCYIAECYDNDTYLLIDSETNKALKSRVHFNRLRKYRAELGRPTNTTTEPTDKSEIEETKSLDEEVNDSSSESDQSKSIEPNSNKEITKQQEIPVQYKPVERLIKSANYKGKRIYLVKWKDKGLKSTWQGVEDIPPNLIREFHIKKTMSGRAKRRKIKQ